MTLRLYHTPNQLAAMYDTYQGNGLLEARERGIATDLVELYAHVYALGQFTLAELERLSSYRGGGYLLSDSDVDFANTYEVW